MNDSKERTFTITDSKGNVQEYEILFTFDSEEEKKSYIIFTDNNKDKDGNIYTYAATYKKDSQRLELNDIETDKEWALIENLLSQIEDKINE